MALETPIFLYSQQFDRPEGAVFRRNLVAANILEVGFAALIVIICSSWQLELAYMYLWDFGWRVSATLPTPVGAAESTTTDEQDTANQWLDDVQFCPEKCFQGTHRRRFSDGYQSGAAWRCSQDGVSPPPQW
jgi:hypothetical protein